MQTAAQIALAVDGEVRGQGSIALAGVASLAAAGRDQLSLFTGAAHARQLRGSLAGAILTSGPDLARARQLAGARPEPTWIVCADARLALATAARLLRPTRALRGVHPSAVVDASAQLAPDVWVGPLAVVEAGAWVGEGAQIGPQAYVGAAARVGPRCRLAAGAKLMAGCTLGREVVLCAGAVVGSEGFGFAAGPGGRRQRMPQLGAVRLGDGCEVGANSCIDRGSLDDTVVGRGVKIDNLVQVGHNCQLADHVVMCSQSGVAGSSTLGAGVVVGAQAGIGDHLEVAAGVSLCARAGVVRSVEAEGATLGGIPAMPRGRWLRSARVAEDLPSWRRRIEALERRADGLPEPSRGGATR